jgi:diguanylate cyclase (GGDEF)-like protein/PAS domain S-box-containing protein
MIGFALYQYQLFDIVPMANDLIVNNFSEGVITLDLYGRVIGINPSACQIVCTKARDAIGQPVKSILLFANEPAFHLDIGNKALTIKHDDLNGTAHYYDVTTLPIKNRKEITVGTLITIKDVTERHLSFMEARILATTDSLTGAYNRRHFIEFLEAEISRSTRLSLPLAVIMFDIDDFKHFNDKYGHAVGDEILILVTKTCQANLRNFDLLGRYGGDEFVLLLPQANPTLAVSVAERLCRIIRQLRVTVNDKIVSVTISMGVTGYDGQGKETADKLLQSADMALYKAKENGKNQFSVCIFGE